MEAEIQPRFGTGLLCDQTQLESEANLLIPGCGEEKFSVYCRAPKGVQVADAQKPQTPRWLSGKTFKDRVRERVAWYMINLWTFF